MTKNDKAAQQTQFSCFINSKIGGAAMRWVTSLYVMLCVTAMTPADVRGQDSDKLTEISLEQARELAAQPSNGVFRLNGLKTLSPEAAAALVKSSARIIWLNGLTSLSPEVASLLVENENRSLSLNGLTTLAPEAAAALANQKGGYLNLNGLRTLTPEIAAALAKSSASIFLMGLPTLSPETATELTRYRGRGIYLSGIKELKPEAAQILANQDRLFLPGKVLLPSQEQAVPITYSQAQNKKAITRRETDSATVKLVDKVPQLFFRAAASEEFVTAGPKLPARSENNRLYSAKCWSFSPDGKLVAIGSEYRAGRGSDPDDPVCRGDIRVWEVATGKLVSDTGEQRLGAIKRCAFSEDSRTIYFDADKYADR